MASPSECFAGEVLRPCRRYEGRSPAAIARRCGAILALLALAGYRQLIVLHPKGVVGEGTSTLLIDSFIIMLPIVVPTILAALLFGWWYRSSNKRAYFQPSFVESGKIELVTWSLAAADDHPRRERSLDRAARARSSKAAVVRRQGAQHPGRIARLEMAVHLPRPKRRQREPSCHSRRGRDPRPRGHHYVPIMAYAGRSQ